MSQMASRWPTLISASVSRDDLDSEGRLTDAAVERLIHDARTAYLNGCRTLDPQVVSATTAAVRHGAPVDGERVTVSVSVVEVFPETFEMEGRIRSERGGDIVAETRCSVTVEGGVSTPIRDELIARAHGARYMH